MDLTFSKYSFEKKGGQITSYSISEINQSFIRPLYIYICMYERDYQNQV